MEIIFIIIQLISIVNVFFDTRVYLEAYCLLSNHVDIFQLSYYYSYQVHFLCAQRAYSVWVQPIKFVETFFTVQPIANF